MNKATALNLVWSIWRGSQTGMAKYQKCELSSLQNHLCLPLEVNGFEVL